MSVITGEVKTKDEVLKSLRAFYLKRINGDRVTLDEAEEAIGEALVYLQSSLAR